MRLDPSRRPPGSVSKWERGLWGDLPRALRALPSAPDTPAWRSGRPAPSRPFVQSRAPTSPSSDTTSCKDMLVPTELFSVDWDGFTLERLATELRDELSGPEAERMIFAFEEALRLARTDEELLPHLLAATTCLLAQVEGTTPRDVLETFFRRSVSDQEWRERYVPLFE